MSEKTLFDFEKDDEYKAWPDAEVHMCIECKKLRVYYSETMIDTCEAVPRGIENMGKRQRFDVQKIGKRKCRYFERNNVPDWLIAAKEKQITESIAYYKRHYRGD